MPSSFSVGAVQLRVAEPVDTLTTVIENAGSVASPPLPSLTLITMFELVPTSAAVGVPDRRPVVVLKLAQAGLFAIPKATVSLSGSDAVGVKL